MNNLAIQMDLFKNNEEMEGSIFELYEKTPHREFKSHVQFIRAENIREAEDVAVDINPDYWLKMSVRPVSVEYVWQTFERLHYSYFMCKSMLGLDEMLGS